MRLRISHIGVGVLLLALLMLPLTAQGMRQEYFGMEDTLAVKPSIAKEPAIPDTIANDMMDMSLSAQDSAKIEQLNAVGKENPKRDWATWKPNSQRALWLALVLPGAGQIYNRKYWKLPLIYGGFVGCAYAMSWNGQMYHDYAQAYMDIMDDDPTTQSYNQFLHLGAQITESNMDRYKEIFRKRKDRYRRWRDMSMFVMIGVYALSVIDAYVDASLSEFDVSDDLSLRVEPAVLNNQRDKNPFKSSALGLQCSLTF